MNDQMREDVDQQIAIFMKKVTLVFDPSAYPRMADGCKFDAGMRDLEDSLERLRRNFDAYLAACWAVEVQGSLAEEGPLR